MNDMKGLIYDMMRRATSYRTRRWIKNQRWFEPLATRLFGTSVYSASYYEDVERMEHDSVGPISDWIVEHLAPTRVIDVGCGPGHLSLALRERGVQPVCVDISDEALKKTAEKGLPVERFDLTTPGVELPGSPYDLVISCEVAEHLEEKYARGFVEKLTEASNSVFLTAAEPNPSGGIGMFHFNEQPNSYWVELMVEHGFELDEEATQNARRRFADTGVVMHLAKPLIFRQRSDEPVS